MNTEYTSEPTREQIEALDKPALLEFGTAWCGYCRAAQPLIAEAFADHANVQHFKVEDGSGRPLGRSFKIKLWPTLIFLDRGKEVARLVRPTDVKQISTAFTLIDGGG